MEWFDVKDKLPDSEQRVLFCDQYGDMHAGCLIKQDNGLCEWFTKGEWLNFCDVIFWAPIEELPNRLSIQERRVEKAVDNFIDSLGKYISFLEASNERMKQWVDRREKELNKI